MSYYILDISYFKGKCMTYAQLYIIFAVLSLKMMKPPAHNKVAK